MCLIIPKNLLNDYLLSSSLLENSRHFCCWNKSCKQCIHLDAYTHSKKRLKNGNCGRMRLYMIWIVCIHKNAVDPWKFKDSDLNTQHIWSKNGLTMQKIAKNYLQVCFEFKIFWTMGLFRHTCPSCSPQLYMYNNMFEAYFCMIFF